MSDPEWLDASERAAWIRFIAVLELLPAALNAQLETDSDLDHFEYQVMVMLSESEHRRLKMTQLAAATNAKIARLSRVVTRLEQRGFVQRTPCPEDKRATYAVLTDRGMETLVEAAPGHVTFVREKVISALSREQFLQLGEISDRLLTSLDPQRTTFRARHGDEDTRTATP